MVKIWTGTEWIEGRLLPGVNQVLIRNLIYTIDADGMVRVKEKRYRLFEHSYKGEPYGYISK